MTLMSSKDMEGILAIYFFLSGSKILPLLCFQFSTLPGIISLEILPEEEGVSFFMTLFNSWRSALLTTADDT